MTSNGGSGDVTVKVGVPASSHVAANGGLLKTAAGHPLKIIPTGSLPISASGMRTFMVRPNTSSQAPERITTQPGKVAIVGAGADVRRASSPLLKLVHKPGLQSPALHTTPKQEPVVLGLAMGFSPAGIANVRTAPSGVSSPSSSQVKLPAVASPPKNVKEFNVRVRKTASDTAGGRKYHIMKFHSAQKVDVAKWKTINMQRENNMKVFKALADEGPKFGAGSEYGKDAKEEARRKKFGIATKKYDPESQPWLLQEGGLAGKKFKGVRDGGVTENASYYVFQQAGSGAFEAFPVQSWYGFTPVIKYNYLKEEEAEEEFNKRGKVMSRFSTMVRKRIKEKEDEDEGDDDDDDKQKKQSKDKAGASKKKKKEFNLTEMDDWVEESDEGGESESDGEGGKKKKEEEEDDSAAKKKKSKAAKDKKKTTKKKKKKKKTDDSEEEESEGEESDDGDFEGREEDYITDSSGEEGSEPEEEKVLKAMKGVDQEDEEDDDSEEEEEEKKKKEEEEKEKGKKTKKEGEKKEEEISDTSSSDDSDSDSDMEKDTSALFLKKKDKKKASSNESSRAPTPSGEGGEGSGRKRKAGDGEEVVAGKKLKPSNAASKTNSPEGSPGPGQSPPSLVIVAAEKEGLTEDAVRKYLVRKPLTTKDLLAKFKTKKTNLTQPQLVQVMAYYLRRISPVNRMINGKIHWSLAKEGGGGEPSTGAT